MVAATGDPPLAVVGVVFFMLGVLFGTFVLTYPMVQSRYEDRVCGIALGTINGGVVLHGGGVSDADGVGIGHLLDWRRNGRVPGLHGVRTLGRVRDGGLRRVDGVCCAVKLY